MIQILSAVLGAGMMTALYALTLMIMIRRNKLDQPQTEGRHLPADYILSGAAVFVWGCVFFLWKRGLSLFFAQMLLEMAAVWFMAVLAVVDRRRKTIPNGFILILLLIYTVIAVSGCLADSSHGVALLGQSLIGGVIAGAVFLLCYLISRGQVGAGDVKLVFVLGLYLTGQYIIGALFYGIVLCCIYSIIQLIRKKLGMKDGVPLVPFLYAGTLAALIILG